MRQSGAIHLANSPPTIVALGLALHCMKFLPAAQPAWDWHKARGPEARSHLLQTDPIRHFSNMRP
jgi:hypothetical protein